jgi:AraC-like DNA-binding protein
MDMKRTEREAWRVAVVWADERGELAELLQAAYREADLVGTISLLQFPASAPRFAREVAQPLKRWRPHGVLVNMLDWKKLKTLRRRMPGVPFVGCQFVPDGMVDTCVVMDAAEALRVAVDYYRRQGLRTLGLYYSGTRILAPARLAMFHALAPEGVSFEYHHEDQRPGAPRQVPQPDGRVVLEYPHEEKSPRTRALRAWLRELPKPAGIVTAELESAGFLLAQCRHEGLRVPEEVQVIGLDDPEACLQCHPHLTSLVPVWSRLGEAAIQTLLRHMRGETPPPIIRVPGCTLTVRESTGLVPVGARDPESTRKLADKWAVRGVSAKRLAQLAGMGRSTFFEQFAAAAGQTPASYLREKRIEEARRLLRESTASVQVIARKCGFSSIQTFSRSFRQTTGQTPTAYRREAGVGNRESGALRRSSGQVGKMTGGQ